MQIFIKSGSNKTLLLDVTNNDTIADIKDKVHAKEAIPYEYQRYSFAGKFLEDFRTLSSYSIIKNSTLCLSLQLNGGSLIIVKEVTGRIHQVEADCNETLMDIKLKLMHLTGYSMESQKLIFQGAILRDGETLSECGIESG